MKAIRWRILGVIVWLLILGLILRYFFAPLTFAEGLVVGSMLLLGFFVLGEWHFRRQKRRMTQREANLRTEEQKPPVERQEPRLRRLISRVAQIIKNIPSCARQQLVHSVHLAWLIGFSLRLQVRHNWRHLVSILTILSLAVATVTTFFIWIDLAPKDALSEGLDKREFHLIVKRGADALLYRPQALEDVQEYLQKEPLVEASELVWNTWGLTNIGNKSEFYDMSYLFMEGPAPPDAIFVAGREKGQDVFIVNTTYLESMRSWFRVIEGTFRFDNGGILLAKQLHAAMETVLNRTLRVGDRIDLSLARQPLYPRMGRTQLRHLQRLDLGNRTINGLFERWPTRSLRIPGFLEESLGDGLLLDYHEVELSFLGDLERGSGQLLCEPKLFVRLSREELFRTGAYSLGSQVQALEIRMHEQFVNPATLVVFDRTAELREAVDAFKRIRWMVIFAFAPLVLLPQLLLLSLILDEERRQKTIEKAYALRGATRSQLWALRAAEPLIVGPLAIFFGLLLGIQFVSFIPETGRFAQFKKSPEKSLLNDLAWPLASWLLVALLGEVPYILLFCWQIIFRPSGYQPASGTFQKRLADLRRFNPGSLLILSGLLLAMILMATDIREYVMRHQELFATYLAALTILWIGLGIMTVRMLQELLPYLWRTTGRLQGAQMFMTLTFFRDHHRRTVSLAILLTMAFSLIVSGAGYDSTLITGARDEAAYLIGSDFKVFTEEIKKDYLADTVAILAQIVGINIAVPFVFVEGDLGEFHLTIIGTNITAYLKAARWHETSFPPAENNHQDHQTILQSMATDSTGILVSDQLARDANLELGAKLTLANLARDWQVSQMFTVRGIARSAPGFGNLATFQETPRGFGKQLGAVIVDLDTLSSLIEVFWSHLFLLKAEARQTDNDLRDIARVIRELPQARTIYLLPGTNIYDQEWYPVGSITGVFSLNLLIVGLMGVITLPFMMSETVRLRRRELAIFRIFGAFWTQSQNAIFRENSIIACFCLIQGVLVGFLFSWILVTATAHIWSPTRALPYRFMVPLGVVSFWGICLLITLHLSVLGSLIWLKAPSLSQEVRNP